MINVTSLREEVTKQRSTTVQSEFGPIPGSIPYLEGLLTDSLSLDERHLIFAVILSECSRAKNDQLELHFLRRQVSVLPKQPVLLVGLALGLSKFPEFRGDALRTGLDAVSLARLENRQLRYSLTALARLALSLNDYAVIERALTELVADKGTERSEDTPYEFDFVDQLDARRISPSVISAYRLLQP
jgi:hypothetical protein